MQPKIVTFTKDKGWSFNWVGEGNTKINYEPRSRKGKLATVKDSKTDVSIFIPSSE